MKKVLRYFSIYGFGRTLIKVAGRTRLSFLRFYFIKLLFKKESSISLIGCGQFGFSTISYFLMRKQGNRFLECYDPNKLNQSSAAKFWGYKEQADVTKLIANNKCKILYIASNHASHTPYAIAGLKAGKKIFIEKPVSVSYKQFSELLKAKTETSGDLYVGYNRPFSKAISILKKFPKGQGRLPISLSCFVTGHFIDKNHWYRDKEEGTRICGNLGHWIDLSIHLLNDAGQIPEAFDISISYSNMTEIDDNISVSITTELNDLIVLVLTSRSEPFEGINETINFQSGTLIAKIDDFRSMQIWDREKYFSYSFSPKDVGHQKAINQPFNNWDRDFNEIEVSTVLMLEITEMVQRNQKNRQIIVSDILNDLKNVIAN